MAEFIEPKTKAGKLVTQKELEEVLSIRHRIDVLEAKAKKLKKNSLEPMEEKLKKKLRVGTRCETGLLSLRLKLWKRLNGSWAELAKKYVSAKIIEREQKKNFKNKTYNELEVIINVDYADEQVSRRNRQTTTSEDEE